MCDSVQLQLGLDLLEGHPEGTHVDIRCHPAGVKVAATAQNNTFVHLVLLFSTFCSSVLKPNLDSGLGETQPLAQFLSHERVRIVRLIKQPLQLIQLL